ncbi:ABC transporter ATP-binding protein [Homoserinimonas sp. OAct 916]|uniref:ABC transporter ATP-binding protein n=1 Tax=Homoserinimonas sp. OAct 916 TaxID=2211450 RepID=UPI000DBE75BF|nr:ABC transporter ATP-binding protein [Homoserinimonas sp. OAct 916]
MTAARTVALSLDDITVTTRSGDSIVQNVSIDIPAGSIVGIVGESGAGKSTVALSTLGYEQAGTAISSGRMHLGDREVTFPAKAFVSDIRGKRIAYVPQEPAVSLNPSTRVAASLISMRRLHGMDADISYIRQILRSVHLPSDPGFLRRYPHQLSGGQQQRLCLALGLACEPEVLVLDEITTGLDVVTQEAILDEVRRLATERQIGVIYITHDLAVVAELADRLVVMYAGEIVESGPTSEVIRRPAHPYTKALIEAAPSHRRPSRVRPLDGIVPAIDARPSGCFFAPRCPLATEICRTEHPELGDLSDKHSVRCFHTEKVEPVLEPQLRETGILVEDPKVLLAIDELTASHKTKNGRLTVAESISLQITEGECVALVGESGSGKTTIARSIIGLHTFDSGTVSLGGEPINPAVRSRTRDQRRRMQFIFQNPRGSLNPKQTIQEIVTRPLTQLRGLGRVDAEREFFSLLDEVRLPTSTAGKLPRELSGGERQRIGIARALAAQPDLLICDEVTSSLDVSVQAAVLELLRELGRDRGLGMLFITHDLGVVASIAHEVLVLLKGRICERGSVSDVLSKPSHDYTKSLLFSAPSLQRAADRIGILKGDEDEDRTRTI